MIYSLQNNELSVTISSKGAELQSILHNEHGLEYIWRRRCRLLGKEKPGTVSHCWWLEK